MPGSSHSELMPGSLLGKYRIERLLGHGGMATVYLAVQEGTGLEVALKVLMFRGESNRPGGDVARFIREARLAGGIRHPHWVSVYETGYDSKQNLYYIAMERMQASLANRLRAHGPLPEAEAIAVVEQIALALDKAYETQMVHRDIKPANILYNAAGVCKLTDFGIAKSSRNEETQLTLREAVFGTPAYMSPEQAKDARMVDTRSDIYSLGTVFFELLSGERPYQGETPVQVLAQVITDKPPPDVRSKPKARKIHSDTAKLVACMMAKDPAARPQTPADLIARLQKLKAHMPYAKPEESEEEPEYDDSTIMDPTNPPPTDVMLDAGFPSDPGTVRAPTGGAGHTGMWDGAPTGGGNTGGGTGGGVTGTGGGAFGAGAGEEPRTAVSLPTFSTQAVHDGTVGTVATMGTRFGEGIGRQTVVANRGGRKSAAGKVWAGVAALLLLLLGVSFWASHTNFIPKHAGEPGVLGSICRLLYFGPDPAEPPSGPAVPVEPEPVPNHASGSPEPESEDVPSVPARLRFVNQTDRPIWVEAVPGGWKRGFEVSENNSVVKDVPPGLKGTVSYKPSWGDDEFEKTVPKPVEAPTAGMTRDIDLELVPRKESQPEKPATINFVNTHSVDVEITPIGEWKTSSFTITANSNVLREFKSGSKIEYIVSAPYDSDDFQETPGNEIAPAAGETKPVKLTLNRKAATSQIAQAWIDFRNTNTVPVKITPAGEWAKRAKAFDIFDASNVVRVFRAGEKISYEVSTPTSSDFKPASREATAPAAGTTNRVDIVLTAADRQTPTYAMLTLRNPNDVTVWVELSGGGSGRHSMPPKGPPLELPIEAGRATMVSYFATDPQFKEYGKDNAHTETVTGNTDLSLTLTKQEAPSLTVTNTGAVKLTIILRSTGDGRELGRGPVEVQEAVTFSDLPVGDPLSLEWTADGVAGYQRGSKPLEGLSWGQAAKVDLKAERLAGPKLELRNVSSWPLNVEIDGVRTFRLELDGRETVTLPRSGRYHVKTTVIHNKRTDAFTNPDDYESTDETLDCAWGQSYALNCSANVRRPEEAPDDANADQYEAYGETSLKSNLRAAMADVEGTWVEHAYAGTITRIDQALKNAKRFSRGVDVDGIVSDVVPYSKWRQGVATKVSFRDATWRTIVRTTRDNTSWNDFLEAYDR